MPEEILMQAFCEDKIYSFERSQFHSFSTFGGPLCCHIFGMSEAYNPIHHMATVSSRDIPFLQSSQAQFRLPLIYGICHDGCDISYQLDNQDHIDLISITPEEAHPEWPYPNYPKLLPYIPLRLQSIKPAAYSDFALSIPNLEEVQSSDLIIAIPPPATIGVSLWGEGDAENVIIVFYYSKSARKISACSLCT